VKLAVKVRIPYWAKGATVTLNGKALEGEHATASFATIERTWRSGDRVEIRLPMRLHLAPMPDDENLVAVMYGPMVLAGRLGTEKFAKAIQFQGDQRAQHGAAGIEVPVLVGAGADPASWLRRLPGSAVAFRTEGVGQPAEVTPGAAAQTFLTNAIPFTGAATRRRRMRKAWRRRGGRRR
jgi:uncharacterized protein